MEDKDFPRVLVISHNSFSMVLNNGKTLSKIFQGWPQEKIAQLYFYNERPSFSVCKKFYRITDQDMVFERKGFVGSIIEENFEDCQHSSKKEAVYSLLQRGRNSTFLSTIRNIVWKSKKWNNKSLWKWLTIYAPQAVFIACGGSAHPYEIAYEISVKFKIPIFLYFGDDYLLPYFTLDVFRWVNWFWLRKAINKIMPLVRSAFVICEEMAEAYEKILGNICNVVMTPVNLREYEEFKRIKPKDNSVIRIAYFGGFHLNRWKVLVKLGEAIKKVSTEKGVDIELAIYSNRKPDRKILKRITDVPYTRFAGSVNEKQIITEMAKYDMLVHVESFDWRTRQKTKLSISTKIPEYLATGKPILAIGPSELSSIKYLERNNAGYILNSFNRKRLEEFVLIISEERSRFSQIGKKNLNLAFVNHDIEKSRVLLKEVLGNNYSQPTQH